MSLGPYLDAGNAGSAFVAAISQPSSPPPDYSQAFARAVAVPVGSGAAFDPGHVEQQPSRWMQEAYRPPGGGMESVFDPGMLSNPVSPWEVAGYVPLDQSGVTPEWLRSRDTGGMNQVRMAERGFEDGSTFDPSAGQALRNFDVPPDFLDMLNQRGAYAPPPRSIRMMGDTGRDIVPLTDTSNDEQFKVDIQGGQWLRRFDDPEEIERLRPTPSPDQPDRWERGQDTPPSQMEGDYGGDWDARPNYEKWLKDTGQWPPTVSGGRPPGVASVPPTMPLDTHERGGGQNIQFEPPEEYESLRNAFEPLVRAYQRGGEWDPDAVQVLTAAALAAREQAQDTPPGGHPIPSFTAEQVAAMDRNAPELQQPYFLEGGPRGPVLTKPLGSLSEIDEIAGQRMSGQNLANVLDALAAPERSFRAFILDHNLAASEQSEEYRRLRASGMDELGAATQVRLDAERAYEDAERGAIWSGADAPFPTFGVPVLLNMLDPRNDERVRSAAADQIGGAISSALLDPTNLIDLTPAGFLLLAGIRGAKMSTTAAARQAILDSLRKANVNADDANIIKVVDRFVAKPESVAAQKALADVFKAAKATLSPEDKRSLFGVGKTQAERDAMFQAGQGDATRIIQEDLLGKKPGEYTNPFDRPYRGDLGKGATPPAQPKPTAEQWSAAFGEQFVNPPEGKTARVVRTAQDEATGVAAAIVEPNPQRAKIVREALKDFPSHAGPAQRAGSQPNKGAEIAKVLREAFRSQLSITPETFIAMPGIRQQLRDAVKSAGGNPKSNVQVRQLADALIQRERIAVLAGKADEVYKAARRSGVDKATARKMQDEAMQRYRDYVPDGKGGAILDVEKEVPPPTLALGSGQRLALPAPGQTAPRTTEQFVKDMIARSGGKIESVTEPARISATAARKEIQRLKALAQEPLFDKETVFQKARRMQRGLTERPPETTQGTVLKNEFRRLTNGGKTPEEALDIMFPPGTPGYVIDGQSHALRPKGGKGTAIGEAGKPTGYKTAEQDMRLGEYWRSLTPVQKFEFLWASPKSLLATGDLGWTLRQGGAILVAALTGGDVKGAARMIRRELEAFKSQEFADKAIEQITLADDYTFLREHGLAIQFTRDDQDWLAAMAGKKSERNEVMQVSLAHFIDLRLNVMGRKIGLPLGQITRASERAGAVYLNLQRVEAARAFVDLRQAIAAGEKGAVGLSLPGGKRIDTGIGRGMEVSDTNYDDYFRFLSALSGRGSFGSFLERTPGAPMILSLPFFAPRWAISRFQLMVEPAIPLVRGATSAVRGEGAEAAGHFATAAQEAQVVAKWWVGTAAAIKLAQTAGWDPELDPTATNFGTIPVGDTGMRIDLIPGGMRTVFVFLARELGNVTTSSTGRTRELGAAGPFQQDRWGLAGDFMMNKLNVPISVGKNLMTGEHFGDPYGPFARDDSALDRLEGALQVASDTMFPLPVSNTVEAILNGGPLGAIFAGTEFFGAGSVGTSTQKKKAEASDAARALPPTPTAPRPAPSVPQITPTSPPTGGGGRILRR